jgi:hypothetical protein
MAKIKQYSEKKKLVGLPDTTNIADAQTRLYLDRLKQSFQVVINSIEDLRSSCITQNALKGYLDKYMIDTQTPDPNPIPPSPVPIPPIPDPDSVKLQGISVYPATMKLNIQGQTTGSFGVSYIPNNVPNRKKGVIWSSSDQEAATVDDNGNVTAVAKGLSIISAVSKYDGEIYGSATLEIVDEKESNLESIEISPSVVEIDPSESNAKMLSVTYNPNNIPSNQRGVTWSSSNYDIVEVDQTGTVYAVGEKGECTVTATSDYSSAISDSVKVTVLEAAVFDIEAPYSWCGREDDSLILTEKETPAEDDYIWMTTPQRITIKKGKTKEQAIKEAAYSTVASVTYEDYIVPQGSETPYFRSKQNDKTIGYTTIPVYPNYIYGRGGNKPSEAAFWTTDIESLTKNGRMFYEAHYPSGNASDKVKEEYSTKTNEIDGIDPNADRPAVDDGSIDGYYSISKSNVGGTNAVPYALYSWAVQDEDNPQQQHESLPYQPYGYLIKTGNKTTIRNPDFAHDPGLLDETFIELTTYDNKYTVWCNENWYIGSEHGCLRGKPSYVPIVEGHPERGHRLEPRPHFTYKNENGDDIPFDGGHTWIVHITQADSPVERDGKFYDTAFDAHDSGNVYEPDEYSAWALVPTSMNATLTDIIYVNVKNESVGGKYGTIDKTKLEFNEAGTIGKTGNAVYFIDSAKGDRGYTTMVVKSE